MLHLILVVVLIIIAAMIFTSKEKFAETSFYYEAAPGARAARMVCMPEGNGPSLGIAVTKAAKYAATCNAPKFDHSSGNVVVQAQKAQKAKKSKKSKMAQMADSDSDDSDDNAWDQPSASAMRKIRAPVRNLKALSVSGRKPIATTMTQKKFRLTSVPDSRLSGAMQAAVYDPSRPPPMMMTMPGKSLGKKPTGGCGAGKVWDGKKCRLPKAKGGTKGTSRGCGAGKVWDGKKCRLPKAQGGKKDKKDTSRGGSVSKTTKQKKEECKKQGKKYKNGRCVSKTSGGGGSSSSGGGGSKTTKQKKDECKERGKKWKDGRCVNKTSGGGSSSSGGGGGGSPAGGSSSSGGDKDKKCPPGRYRDGSTKECRSNTGPLSDERMTERSAQLAASNAGGGSSNAPNFGLVRA